MFIFRFLLAEERDETTPFHKALVLPSHSLSQVCIHYQKTLILSCSLYQNSILLIFGYLFSRRHVRTASAEHSQAQASLERKKVKIAVWGNPDPRPDKICPNPDPDLPSG